MSNPNEWPFDQAPDVAAVTTKQVIEENYPIRQVVHYGDDHSWAFMCGTTEDTEDYRLIHMGEVLKLDETLKSIADLPPGWSAWRNDMGSSWEKQPEVPESE